VIRLPVHRWTAYAATFVAVALLAFATVKSAVMQVDAQTLFGQVPICSVTNDGVSADPHHGSTTACAFCAAAAHAPIQSYAPPLRQPCAVPWRPSVSAPDLAVVQPEAPAPRARGPPASL
jgi:hypothetical protein